MTRDAEVSLQTMENASVAISLGRGHCTLYNIKVSSYRIKLNLFQQPQTHQYSIVLYLHRFVKKKTDNEICTQLTSRPAYCQYCDYCHIFTWQFIIIRQFTRATHCSLSRTKIVLLFNREGIKNQFCIVGCYTDYKLAGYVLIPKPHFSSCEGINYHCRRFDRSCRRSCCRRSDGPLTINK